MHQNLVVHEPQWDSVRSKTLRAYYQKVNVKLVWFQDVETMSNPHLVGLLGFGPNKAAIK